MKKPVQKRTSKRKQPNRTMPIVLIAGGGVLLLAVAFFFALNAPTTEAPQGGLSSSVTTPFPNIARITLEDSKALYDDGAALFVDVRDPGSFEAGRIPGSLNIPLLEIEDSLDQLPKDRWIVTYCT